MGPEGCALAPEGLPSLPCQSELVLWEISSGGNVQEETKGKEMNFLIRPGPLKNPESD